MYNNSSKLMFSFSLMLGTMITISANSWFNAWMGLEINLLSFIPLMTTNNNLLSTEASLKYFLTQALASTILLFSFILLMSKKKIDQFILMMIMSSLLLKTGAAPFHFWFPSIMEGLSWINSFILMTWQKIAPFMLISYMNMNLMILTSAIFSVIMGSLGGLNQSFLRKLMAYSSINHLGWMLSSLMMSELMWIMYFIFYTFLSFNVILLFNMVKVFHINQLFSKFYNSKALKFMFMFNLLSLGGLPPFIGFLPKWMIINFMNLNNQYMLSFILISFTLITLFFYLRICYTGFLLNYYEMYWFTNMKFNKIQMYTSLILTSISMLGLFLISLIYTMF